MPTEQGKKDFIEALKAELAYQVSLIPKLEWAVRVAQAKLAGANAALELARLQNLGMEDQCPPTA